MNLKKWELTHCPLPDQDRWRLKLKIDESDLSALTSHLPVTLSRPFMLEGDDYSVAYYLYDLTDASADALQYALRIYADPFVSIAAPLRSVQFQHLDLVARYTFQEFVIGPNNRFTAAAAQAVADNPGKIYNPFFIYGGVGMGKTHLMHAVGHYIRAKNPEMKIAYVTSEEFISDVIEAVRNNVLLEMRDHYRQIDLLLVDDIQFLANSESTQEEFFHTFNVLHQNGKQIIVTSDRPPKHLTTLEDRLRSRFEWGLTADIKSPNLETRVAILKKKGESEKLNLDDNMLLYIASKLKTNIRELEGFLKRINAYASLTRQEVTMELVKSIMFDLLPPEEMDEAANIPTPAAPAHIPPPAAALTPTQPSILPPPVSQHVSRSVDSPSIPPLPQVTVPARSAETEDPPVKSVEVAFFYPVGKETALVTVKERFAEVIKKHKLKFHVVGVLESAYTFDAGFDYFVFPRVCKDNKVTIAVVLGPPAAAGTDLDEFSNMLAATVAEAGISLQFIPWQELKEDYRYLNLALDITLIRKKA